MEPEKQLYQWDVNQYLTELQPTAEFVDYPIGNEVIRIKADGTRCRIPDEVLQTYGGKTCYERYPDGTYRAYSFTVLYAPKPPEYVYTPEERTTFETLTARVDAAIEEIKRRADSGEFTPKKGVDYFTDAEKDEMMESVSSGAIGEFRNVVDTATTEYNANHNSQLAEYNANAAEKLTTYNTNAEQHTTDYNANATEKLEAYNQNHTAKVAEYNQNAETKTAEFDSNAAALQTEVDRLRGECDNLSAENRKQENRIDALIKLNKGQTYDILPEEGETASRTAPSGAKYVSVDKVGGKSVVWNQLIRAMRGSGSEKGLTFTKNADGSLDISGTITEAFAYNYVPFTFTDLNFKRDGRKYLLMLNKPIPYAWGVSGYGANIPANSIGGMWSNNAGENLVNGLIFRAGVGTTIDIQNLKAMVFDLTQMLGSTIADYIYSLEQSQAGAGVAWFKQMFPADYYPYSEPTIMSSQTDRVDVRGKNLFDSKELNVYSDIYIPANTTFIVSCDDNSSQNLYGIKVMYDDGSAEGWYLSSSTLVNDRRYRILTLKKTIIKMCRSYGEANNYMVALGTTNYDYSPYSLQQITTGFPVLNSACSVYDYIDLNEGKLHRRVGVVDLGSLSWMYEGSSFRTISLWGLVKNYESTQTPNVLTTKYTPVSYNTDWGNGIISFTYGIDKRKLVIYDSDYTDATAFKEAMQGVMLYYELAEEVITDIEIPTELTDWLEVEAGGTVAFRNADESKQLAVPNGVSWVRKLNEVN